MTGSSVGRRSRGAIVLSTGYCGSTLLSDLLDEHPETAAMQEFFIYTVSALAKVHPGKQTGREFWELISKPVDITRVLHRIDRLPREIRYTPETGHPGAELNMCGILGATLPALSDDPEGLLRELGVVVPGFPAQTPHDHCIRLFEFLAGTCGKRNWVERSGASFIFADGLVEMFPELPFVHLTRNCVDTAITASMSPSMAALYVGFRISEEVGVNPYLGAEYDPQDIPEHLAPLLPENLAAETLDGFIGSFELIVYFVVHQALMHQSAEGVLKGMPGGQLLRIRYEDLVRDPRDCLGRVGDFLGFSDCGKWVDGVAHRVGVRPPRVALDDAQRRHLHELFDRLRPAPIEEYRNIVGAWSTEL